jgi:tetratricopeptide (TPR) repeat protein
MVFGAIFPLSSLLHESMNEKQLVSHYAGALTEKRLSGLRAEQKKLTQSVQADKNLLENQLSQLETLGKKNKSPLTPEIKTGLSDLENQKTENLMKLSKTLNQVNPAQFGSQGKEIIQSFSAQSHSYHQNIQDLNKVESQVSSIRSLVDRDVAEFSTAMTLYPKLSGKLNALIQQMDGLEISLQTLSHPLVKDYLETKKEIAGHQKIIARLTQEVMGPDLENFLRDEDKRIQAGLQNYSKLAILLQAVREVEQANHYSQNVQKLNQKASIDLIRLKNIEQVKQKLAEIEILEKAGELIEDSKTTKLQILRRTLDSEAALQTFEKHTDSTGPQYQALIKRLEKLYAGYSYMSQGYAQITHSLYEKTKLTKLENDYAHLKKVLPVNDAEKLAFRRARTRYLIEKSKQQGQGEAAIAYERYQNYYLQTKKAPHASAALEAETELDLALNELETELSNKI